MFKTIVNIFTYEKNLSYLCIKILIVLLRVRKVTSYKYAFCILQFQYHFRFC